MEVNMTQGLSILMPMMLILVLLFTQYGGHGSVMYPSPSVVYPSPPNNVVYYPVPDHHHHGPKPIETDMIKMPDALFKVSELLGKDYVWTAEDRKVDPAPKFQFPENGQCSTMYRMKWRQRVHNDAQEIQVTRTVNGRTDWKMCYEVADGHDMKKLVCDGKGADRQFAAHREHSTVSCRQVGTHLRSRWERFNEYTGPHASGTGTMFELKGSRLDSTSKKERLSTKSKCQEKHRCPSHIQWEKFSDAKWMGRTAMRASAMDLTNGKVDAQGPYPEVHIVDIFQKTVHHLGPHNAKAVQTVAQDIETKFIVAWRVENDEYNQNVWHGYNNTLTILSEFTPSTMLDGSHFNPPQGVGCPNKQGNPIHPSMP